MACRSVVEPGLAWLFLPVSPLGELKGLLKRQQEQLNQLTPTVAYMQTSMPPARPQRNGPVICLRCRQPGHFARDCEGERARAGPAASRTSTVARPTNSSHHLENQHPLSCRVTVQMGS